jgi:polar amino acid transport system permease protein
VTRRRRDCNPPTGPATQGGYRRRRPLFAFCTNPAALDGLAWLACYLTTGGHLAFYSAFGTVLALLAITAPAALLFGFGGAIAARSTVPPLRWLGKGYIAIVRGVPDIAFFLFFVIALDQGLEYLRHVSLCPDWTDPVRQGANFLVCPDAKLPQGRAPQWVHEAYGFALAVVTFAIVFGAFAANVLFGAMRAVPRAQIETAEAYGMSRGQTFRRITVPQMWLYALPGLSNLWLILVKATPLLFLLGVEDVVYWAQTLGAAKTPRFSDYPHPDWRMWYFLALLVFYLAFTRVSEVVFARLTDRLSRGQATAGGEAMRRAGA